MGKNVETNAENSNKISSLERNVTIVQENEETPLKYDNNKPGNWYSHKNYHANQETLIFKVFNICEFPKVIIISAGSNAENKKPLTRLQKEKSTANDDDNWELVPPDGGWVSNQFI